jgi:hypothetical protein
LVGVVGAGRVAGPATAAAARAVGGFELEYCVRGADWRREPLWVCAGERFEDAVPVRPFHFGKGQASFAGWWWMASTGSHVGFESWLERDHLMLLDFAAEVTAVSSQPFWLHWQGEGGRDRRHAPDFFVRLADGTGVVVDVRPDDRIPEKDVEVFAVTAAACAVVGWEFRRLGEIDPVLAANVRWLSRYRHPRCAAAGDIAAALVEVFADGAGLFAGAELAGERLRVLPVLFHLMWRGCLVADLSLGPLGPATLVRTGDGR